MAVYIVPSGGRSGRPMLASKICDIQRIDCRTRQCALAPLVPIRTVTHHSARIFLASRPLCVATYDDNALRALVKSMKPNVVLP